MKKAILLFAFCTSLYNALAQESKLAAKFDKVLKEEFPLKETGVAILVSSKGKIIYKHATGMSNAELAVPMETDHVFRIASITKQFTAVAILQLMEQGKLRVDDDITRFYPGYPTQGSKITVEHLLTHTSGIQDFTSIKDSTQRGKIDMTSGQVIEVFKDQPLRFAPGSRYEYSNSNYVLLGYIVEKISGKSYGAYLEEHIFSPAGMRSSYLSMDNRIIPNRAAGYTKTERGFENAAQFSMSQPYAAGAILSTVEDLFKWNEALRSAKLLKKETLQKAYQRYRLTNGKEINYGYGFRTGYIQGSPSLWHGGLINGFMTMAMYLPAEDVYVVVLSNCDCISPDRLTSKLAAIAIGKPYEFVEVPQDSAILKQYEGVYENENGDQVIISTGGGKLKLQRGKGPSVPVKSFAKDNFYFEDQFMTLKFVRNEPGIPVMLTIQHRNGIEKWRRSEKPATIQAEIKVEEKILERYTGEYEIGPGFTFVVTREGSRIFLQATGQEKLEMFAEAVNRFFLKVNDAQVEFVEQGGSITKAILKQGGRMTDAMKIK